MQVNKYKLSYLDFSYKMYETGSVIQYNAWLVTSTPVKVLPQYWGDIC